MFSIKSIVATGDNTNLIVKPAVDYQIVRALSIGIITNNENMHI
jgi:hypothetical protein